MSPSLEKRTSFCVMERRIRSFVRGQTIGCVSGEEESHPEPMGNFFSAFEMVWRRIFSAFGVRVQACMSEMPYGLGEVGVVGEERDGDDGAYG